VVIWYIFPHFGILHQEKSGNPGPGGGTAVTFVQPVNPAQGDQMSF
jgi:hypothetical protein